MRKGCLVLGAGGFIGNHMVRKLKEEGYFVRGVDLKHPEFDNSKADEFLIGDLRQVENLTSSLKFPLDVELVEIYQFAADMGGAGFVFTGENDSDIMHNSSLINLNLLGEYVKVFPNGDTKRPKVFYSSSACMYPSYNQEDPSNPNCKEDSAYPAFPDSEYGWEKLFSERLFLAFERNHGIPIKIARYHNIFGPLGTWDGGREKAPAAICRKVLMAEKGGEIEIWGDGEQTRSFLYIDDCIEATLKLMRNEGFSGPVNIGSEEMVTINELVRIVSSTANKKLSVTHIPGPIGVRGRNSDNKLIWNELKWKPSFTLAQGVQATLAWIEEQIHFSKSNSPE
jgi:GDP-D-mannose 3',5'-epimerase